MKKFLIFSLIFTAPFFCGCKNNNNQQITDLDSNTKKTETINLTLSNMNYYLDISKQVTYDSPRTICITEVVITGAYYQAIYRNCQLSYVDVDGTFTVNLSASGSATFSYKQSYTNNVPFSFTSASGTIEVISNE